MFYINKGTNCNEMYIGFTQALNNRYSTLKTNIKLPKNKKKIFMHQNIFMNSAKETFE